MKLHPYWLGLDKESRKKFAKKAGTKISYLWQVAQGHRNASASLARRIEIATDGTVTKEELRPDIYE